MRALQCPVTKRCTDLFSRDVSVTSLHYNYLLISTYVFGNRIKACSYQSFICARLACVYYKMHLFGQLSKMWSDLSRCGSTKLHNNFHLVMTYLESVSKWEEKNIIHRLTKTNRRTDTIKAQSIERPKCQ